MWFFKWNKLHVPDNGMWYSSIKLHEDRWYFFGVRFNSITGEVSVWMDGELAYSYANDPKVMKRPTGDPVEIYLGFNKMHSIYWRGGTVACLMIYAAALSRDLMRQARTQCLRTFYGKTNTPFTGSKNYLDCDLDSNLDCNLDRDPEVFTGHSLFNTTKRITLLFIVQTL